MGLWYEVDVSARSRPGPPDEKEPPPPRRYCRTVAVTAAFVSLQPPSSSNAIAECVKESALNCLQTISQIQEIACVCLTYHEFQTPECCI